MHVAELRVTREHVNAVTMWGAGEIPGEIPRDHKWLHLLQDPLPSPPSQHRALSLAKSSEEMVAGLLC